MTDAEINLAIAKIEHPDVIRPDTNYVFNVDYCNNWNDIGTIIEREGIGLKRDKNHWEAYRYAVDPSSFWVHYAHAETPTKAAALCYLKMKGVE